jgi:transposase
METYPRTAAERAMKLQEVLLRAAAGKIKWWQAAELIGISERQMRRWRKRFEEQGYKGLLDRRVGIPSRRRVPKEKAEEVLSLYRDKYFDLNVRHFPEKLGEESDWLELHLGQAGFAGGRPSEAQGQATRTPQRA